jgi:hypothetical protein
MMASERVLGILRTSLGELPGKETRGATWHAFDFEPADGGAYNFRIASCGDDQLEIRAYPHPNPEGADLFWHMVISRNEYSSSDEFLRATCNSVTEVLTSPTRIIQRKRLLGWQFRCEAFTSGMWSKVYAISTWDTCCHPPKIAGREATFTAQPLLKARRGELSV